MGLGGASGRFLERSSYVFLYRSGCRGCREGFLVGRWFLGEIGGSIWFKMGFLVFKFGVVGGFCCELVFFVFRGFCWFYN